MPTQLVFVKSSFIRSIGYNAGRRTATVCFRSGALYQYKNVSKVTFTRWLKSPSKGKYFRRNIRGVYAYAQI
ncbi:hypothetical protein ANRL1_03167 [Anaerolineae bacterium]|nr:hypothetical protein ANRL1_03167 [Anaerolineae bacterium]